MVGVTASALMAVMFHLLSKLSTLLGKEYNKLKGVRKKITILRDELSSMNTSLEMLSESEEANPQVKEWMSQLRELSYDVEDCIEIFMHNLSHDRACDGLIDKITSKAITLKARHRIGSQINELMKHALEISDRRKRYELNTSASCSQHAAIDPRLPALFEEADRLIGIDSQIDELVKWLTDGINLHPHRKVVSIVGFGGLGKTTLANEVLRKIKSQFDSTAFVSVSRRPNVKKILSDILQILRSSNAVTAGQNQDIFVKIQEDLNPTTLEYPQLVDMIRRYLQNKRYFIIIDDIWSKKAWKEIQCAFPHDSYASGIMTTTRIQEVAECCCPEDGDCFYPMDPLNYDDSKRLFLKRIFDHEYDCPPELIGVTEKILRKCDGLPLAIVNIASLLATKSPTKQEWETLWNSLGSAPKQDYELETVKKILFLSYYDLPQPLKICLLDLSMFPEDHKIDRLRLIRRWIAEGLIVEQRGQGLQDTAEKYINELINRNMIIPLNIDYNGRPSACRVHDIMLDLLISLSVEENFATIIDDQKLSPSANKTRRISLQGNLEEQNTWQETNFVYHVRSFSAFGVTNSLPSFLKFQVLRVLDLQDCSNLQDSDIEKIGSLIHLRYLSMRNVSNIPRQIGRLKNLQTLNLRSTNIKELPGTIAQLHKLVRLLLPHRVKLPNGIGNMGTLEELSGFDPGTNSPRIVQELGKLTKLKVLGIDWFPNGKTDDEHSLKKSLMSSLPHHLQIFRMFSCRGGRFPRLPNWISCLLELTCLVIPLEHVRGGDMQALERLPALLCLHLHVKELPQETLIISPGGFKCLKEFHFYPQRNLLGLLYLQKKMDGLGLMFEAGAMPRLERLHLIFGALDTLFVYGVGFDFGIRHLSSLKHLQVQISCQSATVREVEAAEAAIRNAAALLPNRPTPVIKRLEDRDMLENENQRSQLHGIRTVPVQGRRGSSRYYYFLLLISMVYFCSMFAAPVCSLGLYHWF